MNSKQILYSYSNKNITLSNALKSCANFLENAIALLYSPKECKFVRFESGNLYELHKDKYNHYQEKIVNLGKYADNYIFEARIFNESYELRWLNENNGIGRSAIIFEKQDSSIQLPEEDKWKFNHIEYIKHLTQHYLLWGEKAQHSLNQSEILKNWQLLSSARIGTITVPLKQELSKDKRVYLKTCEYLKEIGNYSNVAVVEERLIKLEVK